MHVVLVSLVASWSVHAHCVCGCLVFFRLHAVVGFVRGLKAWKTHTLVGAHIIDAPGVFTQ